MNIKKVIGVGDSFVFGDELYDNETLIKRADVWLPKRDEFENKYRQEHCFTGLLAKHFNAEAVNLGYPGASLQSMRNTLADYITNNDISDSLIIVGLTQSWRTSWFNSKTLDNVHSTWLITDEVTGENNYDNVWKQQLRHYIENQECSEASKRNLNETLLFFDGIAARYKVPMIQFNVFCHPFDFIKVPTHYDVDNSMQDMIKDSDMMAPGWHPNEKGHQVIANHFLSIIEKENLI